MKQQLTHIWTRRGKAGKAGITVGALLLLILVVWGAGGFAGADAEREAMANRPTATVQRGPLAITVSESGTIKPRKQLIIKNDLDDDATILHIVPEGTRVKEGDLLLELDITELEEEIVERRIAVLNDEASLIDAEENLKVVKNENTANVEQAELDLKFAKLDLEKYVEGDFPKALKETQASITIAEVELTRAQEQLTWSETLFEEKYLSQSELQQDQLAAQKAQLDLDLAKTDLQLLEQYTRGRELDQLNSDVRQAELALERAKGTASANLAQAEAGFSNRKWRLTEEQSRLSRLTNQVPLATVYSPIDGMVLYATSVQDRWRRDDTPIEVGTSIRERDEIIYLPTAAEFNVDMKISEVDLGKVKAGQEAIISVDAIPDRKFVGLVTKISQLPDSESRYLNPNLKLYNTVIELQENADFLRNGMSCLAEIEVESYDDVLYVPIQAVIREDGVPTVYVVDQDGSATPREVDIGLDNSRFVHVRSGVTEGETILLAPPLNRSEDGGRQREGSEEDAEDPAASLAANES